MGKQFALRMPSTDPTAVVENDDSTSVNDEVEDNGFLGVNEKSERALFRVGTKTDWDPKQLAELKATLKEEMQNIATKQKQDAISKMVEKQDAIRDPSYKENDAKDMMEEMKALQLKEKQKVIGQMAEKYDAIRDPKDMSSSELITPHAFNEEKKDDDDGDEVVDDEQNAADMMAEIQRQKKQQLADQIDRNFQNVTQSTNDVSYKIVTNNDDDAKAMEEHMIAMKKQDLFEATDTFKFSREPQIQPGHYNEFKGLMNSIGILNPNEIDSLWKHIDVTVNGDKREDIIIRAHSITKSVDIDNKEKNKNNVNNIRFRNEMNQNEKIELQNTIKELQKELQSLKKTKGTGRG